jgi:LDH2 family malate/lactate/ureidoglycolate dehydrogenase
LPATQDIPVPQAATAEDLTRFIADAMLAVGLSEADAGSVARLMVEADLTGADAHGVFRLPQYVRRIRGGAVNTRPAIHVRRTGPATAIVDGDNGMGQLVMARAVDAALALARDSGAAWIAARRSNHAGPAGIYPEMLAASGMVGIYSVVASANHMAPWGGSELLIGTNPLAVAVPRGGEPPIVLDIATSAVSYGTVKNHALQGREMPAGWMVARTDGTPVTDPARSSEGMLLPIGGHKGSGLAIVLGLLAGPLSGAVFGRDVIDFNADSSTETNTGHFIIALDVGRFVEPLAFYAEVNRHLVDLRDSERLPGADPIRMPGEQRAARRAERARHGVPIPIALRGKLNEVAEALSIEPLRLRSSS